MNKFDVSIVIINYKTPDLTRSAVDSIVQHSKNFTYEIIIINNSKDYEAKHLFSNYENTHFVQNKRNKGFGRACNQGMEIAKGEYVFFFNSDAYLIDNSIQILHNYMSEDHHKDVMVVGGHLLDEGGKFRNSYSNFHSLRKFIEGSFWNFFYRYNTAKVREIPYYEDRDYEVDYVSGADFFMRRDVFLKIGGFDKRIFMYFEDSDYCFRIKRDILNARIRVVPQAKFVHKGQGSRKNKKDNLKFTLYKLQGRTIYFLNRYGMKAALMVAIHGLLFAIRYKILKNE